MDVTDLKPYRKMSAADWLDSQEEAILRACEDTRGRRPVFEFTQALGVSGTVFYAWLHRDKARFERWNKATRDKKRAGESGETPSEGGE
jgi:hypothetical protein